MVEIRLARPDDAAAVADVHVRSWQAGYRGLLPDAALDAQRSEDRAARYRFDDPEGPRTLLAVEGAVVCGFATTGTGGTRPSAEGELLALYVDPPWWGRGVGRRLLAAARRQLAAAGCTEAVLWVLAGNERAELVYRHDGWRPDGAVRSEVVWGIATQQRAWRRPLP